MRTLEWLLRGPLVPVLIGVAALAIFLASELGRQEPPAPLSAADVPNEMWRCNACARAPGKAWVPCRTVTGRGNEKGARDRVTELVCTEAGVSVASCDLTTIECRRLDDAPEAPDDAPEAPAKAPGSE